MTQKSPRWTGIEARGKQVHLLNGSGSWHMCDAEGPAHANQIVEEIERLMNYRIQQSVKSAEYNRLCRAGD